MDVTAGYRLSGAEVWHDLEYNVKLAILYDKGGDDVA